MSEFSGPFNFVRQEPLKGVDRALMAIAPDHSKCIVALSLHVRRIDILRHLIDLQYLPTVNFIHAKGTPAHDSQMERINRFSEEYLALTGRLMASSVFFLMLFN